GSESDGYAIVVRPILAVGAVQVVCARGGPGIEGNWLGSLGTQPGRLRLALKVAKAPDGSLSAKLDSLDQGAKDLPVSMIRRNGRRVEFELQAIEGGFEGTLTADGSELVGEWKQGGAILPLTFKRTDRVPVASRPQEPRKPYPYTEEEIVYENKRGGAKLAGTLTLPPGKGPFPAVLLITGSGQQDRDESLTGHRPFLVL